MSTPQTDFKYNPQDPNDELYGSQHNPTGISPRGYKLLVEIPMQADLARAKASGLELPETAVDRHLAAAVTARVIQVGSGCYRPERFPEGPWVLPGQYVSMSPYSGTRIKSTVTGLDYRVINEDSIDAVVPSPDFLERG